MTLLIFNASQSSYPCSPRLFYASLFANALSPKLLRPSFKIFFDASKSLSFTVLQLRQVQTLSESFKFSFLTPQPQVLLLA
jgi:hypothetical protein